MKCEFCNEDEALLIESHTVENRTVKLYKCKSCAMKFKKVTVKGE